jgi:putative ABC transport system permease protein
MWRRLFPQRASDADLEDEFAAHLEIETRQLMEGGMTREQAETEARRLFGSRALIAENTREVLGSAAFDRLWRDVHYAARILRRAPAFTAAAVLSLALGIGATTAVFSIADTVFLRPLPYADAGRLVWLGVRFSSIGIDFLPSPDYVAWRRDNRTFQALAATQAHFGTTMVLGTSDPAEVSTGRVSANFLDAFAVTPAFGRSFRPEEELPNGPKAVLLMYPFWRDHFHSRRDIVGSAIALDGQSYTVTGILPQSFVYPVDVKVDLLTTLPVSPTAGHRDRNMSTWAVFGRLKPGVTMAQARADLDTLYAASKADFPQLFRDDKLVLEPLQEHRAGNVRTLLLILMGAAACLLAIACANVANLLLARWSARARELAVRAAIGAARGRLARQLFTEIALLVAAGTMVGMLFVEGALRGFVHFAAGEIPRLSEVGIDFRVFGIALLVSLATALLFGGLPALRSGRIDLQSVLQRAARGTTGGHQFLRRTLVGVEVALSVILLCGATLLLQTLWHLQYDHLGFQPEHVLTVSVPLRGPVSGESAREALAADLLTYLRRIPGTEAASLTQCTPLFAGVGSITFSRSDRPLPEPFHRGDNMGICGTDSEYLKATGTRLVEGRYFNDGDRAHPNTVAVINQAAVRAYFPGEDPLGKQIMGGRASDWRTVVGVIADAKNQGLNHPTIPEVWVNDTNVFGNADLLFLVRSVANEEVVARALRDEMHANHAGIFTKVESLDADMAEQTASPRFNTVLLSTFAAVAFLIAIVGVYGVLAFSVAQRRAEIGIRMAVGATPESVLALVMKEGAATLAAGAIAGVAAALLLTRYLATLLYGVKATDPVTYVAVVAGLALAAAAASFLPARGASRLDPAVALRHE